MEMIVGQLTDRNRFSITHPEVAAEWHPTKNGDLTPNDVTCKNGKNFWWLCSKDDCKYEWDATVCNRTRGRGCPACAGKVITNRNRLSIKNPEVAAEWHPTKNGNLMPNDVTCKNGKIFWWLCSKDDCKYEWDAPVYSRTRGHGCPGCSGQTVTDKNRLSIIYPEVADEWHPTKNGNLMPNDVSFGSHKKIWWFCSKDDCRHEWDAPVKNRTNGGCGCPGCSGLAVTDKNRLSATHPEVADEWHPTKNGNLMPNDVSFASNKKIWWFCSKDDCRHEWDTPVYSRTNGRGCPACAKYGFNPSIPSYLYLISRPNQRKVGIYNEGSDRLNQHAKNGWEIIQEIGPFCGHKIKNLETKVLRSLKSKGIPMGRDAFKEEFDGFSESWQEVDLDVRSLNDLFLHLHVEPNFFC